MKDYATEELGVTGGEWTLNENASKVTSFDENSERWCKHKTVCNTFVYVQQDARLLAASKDLYNVLRAIVDDGARMSDYGHHWVEVDTAVFDEAEALLARLREATK